ncbi:MAG: L-lactate permease [Anaerolineae bacterium]
MTIIDTLFAALPLALIVILMIGMHWSGAKAGAAGWIAALIIAALRFSANAEFLFWAQIDGLFRAIQVLYIIWGALFFFRITEANGALQAMATMLRQITPDRTLQVLIMGWAFTSFLQSVGGFGVPMAVVAPIMVGIGFEPLVAVALPAVGHSWSISFGSLGVSFEALKTATGLEGAVIAPDMALMLGIVCFLAGFCILWLAGGRHALLAGLWPMLLMALTMGGVLYLSVHAGLYNIASMLGALAGLGVGVVWAMLRQHRSDSDATSIPWSKHLASISSYVLLLIVIFSANLIQPLAEFLDKVQVQITIPQVALANGQMITASKTKALSLFGHAGALLFYTGFLTLLLSKVQGTLPPGAGKKIRAGMVRSGWKSTLGILAMVGMATTMEKAGMVPLLSQAMADIAGGLYPLVTPLIGALGAFMTGSNTNSNVLFGAFQQQVAQNLGYVVPMILAIHNAGAAVGSVFAPAKIIVACSTVGLSNREGEALRRITKYCLAILGVLALVGLLITSVQ